LKKYIIACFTGLYPWTFAAEGQLFRPNTEVGGFVGVSYYMGDINLRRQFYAPGIAIGGLVKHNFTEHHVLRFNGFMGNLRGSDLDFNNEFQQVRNHSFECTLLDFGIGYEFNFNPYIVNRRAKRHTTFIFAGVGYSLILSESSGITTNHATIPFGVGYKYRLSNTVSVGGEWGMRKTFTDKIDGVLEPGGGSLLHNNDWYSFAGVYITIRVFEKRFSCPGIHEERRFR